MKYQIILYCPDQHISYNLQTLEKTGVGGGITARIRMAHALAKRGHQVTLFINCPKEEKIQGVNYRQLHQLENVNTDIFIASTSGDGLDLGRVNLSKINAKLKILMIHGVDLPKSVNPEDYDYFYILSNFVRTLAIEKWQINPQKIFVAYRGVKEENNKKPIFLERDPYSLVYMGHPSKGLETAISILRILRKENRDFVLHVFGGNRLWGGIDEPIVKEPGLVNHGLVGQEMLSRHIRQISFSLNLQSREEPFGMVVTESMQAGCIVLASPVGAYPEIIQNGQNGFLIPGCHSEEKTRIETAQLILELVQHPGYMKYIRQNAINSPLNWTTIADVWQSHWDWILEKNETLEDSIPGWVNRCGLCNTKTLWFADGLHCPACGYYQKFSNQQFSADDHGQAGQL
jgi:glycosyltransferase involved in cell wall biosynthesis